MTFSTVAAGAAAVSLCALFAAPGSAAPAPVPAHYRVVALRSLGGVYAQAASIDDTGIVAGAADPAGDAVTHAAAWYGGAGPFDLGAFGGGGANSAIGWPNHDVFPLLAGVSETAAAEPLGEAWSCDAFFYGPPTGRVCVGFVDAFGRMRPLPTLGGYDGFASGTNDSGQVTGWAETTRHDPTCEGAGVGNGQVLQFLPVVWNPPYARATVLPPLAGDSDGAATAINDRGEAVGISGACDQAVGRYTAEHMVAWQGGAVRELPFPPTLGGAAWNTPADVNGAGEIVGFANLRSNRTATFAPHAFAYTPRGGTVDLGTLPGDTISAASGVNASGTIVGFSGSRAFVEPAGGAMTDLNALVEDPGSLYLLSASDVNDGGRIVGQACVLVAGACGPELVGFEAMPDPAWNAARMRLRSTAATRSISLPAAIRARLLRRYLGAAAR